MKGSDRDQAQLLFQKEREKAEGSAWGDGEGAGSGFSLAYLGRGALSSFNKLTFQSALLCHIWG